MNEDNCVLSTWELFFVHNVFMDYEKQPPKNVVVTAPHKTFVKIFKQIAKLNEMAKEKQNERG